MTLMIKTLALSATAALCFAGTTAQAKIATGSSVADMSVVDSNGKTHKLSDFAGKKVILEWTNHQCPYVVRHYESKNMQDLQKSATANGDTVWLSVISSGPGLQGYVSGEKANKLTVKRDAAPTAVIMDPEGTMGQSFSAKTTPHMYIIDENQTLVYQGGIDDDRNGRKLAAGTEVNYVEAALADLAAGRTVAEANTPPYGCSIKYKS